MYANYFLWYSAMKAVDLLLKCLVFVIGPCRKLGNLRNHRNHRKSSEARELQILPIKIKKDKHKSEFDKVCEEKA